MERSRGNTSTLNTIQGVAIAIQRVRADQRHTGIFHKSTENGSLNLMDLCWHKVLRNAAPNRSIDVIWITPPLPQRRLRLVADTCRQIWRANGRGSIPYGFGKPTDCFDDNTHEFLIGPSHLGLTCASFVLAVFARCGTHLIRYEEWPVERDGDTEWQSRIVGDLREQYTDTENVSHIERVEGEIGVVRFRPEEVAGAACAPSLQQRLLNRTATPKK